MRLQFGVNGCYLTIMKESRSRNVPEYTIGDRYDVTALIAKHETMGTFDLRGTWYVYEFSALSESTFSYTLIRNSKDLCLPGDGRTYKASEVETLYGIQGFKPERDFYFTSETSVAKYKTIVRIATKLKYGSFPIFHPNGNVYIANLYSRPIIDQLAYQIILGTGPMLGYEYEVNKIEDYRTYKMIVNEYKASNVFYPPGTILKIYSDAPQAIFIANVIFTMDHEGHISQTAAHAFLIDMSEVYKKKENA